MQAFDGFAILLTILTAHACPGVFSRGVRFPKHTWLANYGCLWALNRTALHREASSLGAFNTGLTLDRSAGRVVYRNTVTVTRGYELGKRHLGMINEY